MLSCIFIITALVMTNRDFTNFNWEKPPKVPYFWTLVDFPL